MIEFKLDIKSGVPFHRQIVDQIRYGIASGRLLPGEQLPTVRELAVQLQVNPNTIRKAYSELEILGYSTHSKARDLRGRSAGRDRRCRETQHVSANLRRARRSRTSIQT